MKYFVVSDVHSFKTALEKDLKKSGFRINYDNHMLIVNGDIFDRGPESLEMKEFLTKIKNKKMIIGNHEFLFIEALNRGYFKPHDLSNGTIDTMIQLTGGYKKYFPLQNFNKAEDYFLGSMFELNDFELQNTIIENVKKKTDTLDWIVENFFDPDENGDKGVKWGKHYDTFKIEGKPRFHLQFGDKLILHGFFPEPPDIKEYKYDLLDESLTEQWLGHGVGVWSRTDYWLDQYYSYHLSGLYKYLRDRGIKNIYLGHWSKKSLEHIGTAISITMNDTYREFSGKLPKIHLLDNATVVTNSVIVEVFTVL